MRRPVLIIGSVLTLIALGLYFLLRPTWRTATEAQVRSVVDPALLESPLSKDRAAQDRYRRLLGSLKEIKTVDPRALQFTSVLRARDFQGFLQEEGARLTEVKAILNEGPYEAPYPQPASERAAIRNLILGLRGEGISLIQAGQGFAGLDLILLSLQLARRQAAGMASADEPVADISLVSEAYVSIAYCIPYLSESELSRVEVAIPRDQEDNSDYQRALRLHFQRQVLPLLADPIKWAETQPSPEEALVAAASAPERGPSSVVIVGYDAFATGRHANLLFTTMYAGAALPPKQRAQTGPNLFAELMRLLPSSEGNMDAPGSAPFLLVERLETRRVPNGFGKQLLIGRYAKLADSLDLVDVRQVQALLLRTLIAFQRYRLRYGNSARSFEEVVAAGLLPSVPQDVFGNGPLHLTPMFLSSMGPPGGKQDHGISFRVP